MKNINNHSNTNAPPDAPESNAGDNFQIVWTVKKSFALLNFDQDGLKAITIEGIDCKSKSKIDPSALLGVDIAEYYGGQDFLSAKKVIISQLKYSTRRVEENWTPYSLCKGKRQGATDGSIIHRLAQIFEGFLNAFGRDLVLEKLSIKLVSNRDISPSLKNTISNFQRFLSVRKTKASTSLLKKEFTHNELIIEKFLKTTKLSSTGFTDFLRILNFEDCGTGSVYYQELEIIDAMLQFGANNISEMKSLCWNVWEKMQPTAIKKKANVITFIDLLHSFQVSMERLFPVSHKFEEIAHIVERKQINDIIDQIMKNDKGLPICLHGGAGFGKSTISRIIKSKTPQGSETILFDCYGAGSYLNPSDSRHLHKEALVHISNELAKNIGSPFLLQSDNDEYMLIREFKDRVESALNILKKRNPSSVLILIVDAADNSITAAEKNCTKSFIEDLFKEQFPEGFRLVVTSRSHRVSSLNLPDGYKEINLNHFDYEESASNLKYYFPESTSVEIKDFHQLSQGIPRVQSYALNSKKNAIEDVINYLKPNGKGVEDLIQDRIEEAIKKIGDSGRALIDTFFSYLITLPRPVPLSYIATLTEMDNAQLKDICTDIWHGLILQNDHLSFRDEDFENYIRDKYKSNDTIYGRIADTFLEKANTDEYASLNLGVSLIEANYLDKLREIVLNNEYISLPIDPMRNKAMYIERTKLAMKVSTSSDDILTFFKLAFITADTLKAETALKELLVNNIDLVVANGNTDSLKVIESLSQEKIWQGSLYLRLAAIYSRGIETLEKADRHLRTAEEWIHWRRNQNERVLRKYDITYEDIAYGAEACLKIYGAEKAYFWLKEWRPQLAIFRATQLLLDTIIRCNNVEEVVGWVNPLNLPVYVKLIVLEKLGYNEINLFNLNEIGNTLRRAISRGVRFEEYLLPSILSYCEHSVNLPACNKDLICEILDSFKIVLPLNTHPIIENPRDLPDNGLSIDIFLRKECLKASLLENTLSIEDIYPEEYPRTEDEFDNRTKEFTKNQKDEFNRFYKHAIPIYQLRANILSSPTLKEGIKRFNSICKDVKDDSNLRYYDSWSAHDKLTFLALKLLDVIPFWGRHEELINTIISSFESKNNERESIFFRIYIVKKLATNEKLKKYIVSLLNDIHTRIEKSTFTSETMIDFYVRCSKIALSIDKHLSKYYFDKAIEAVKEVDIEAQEQIWSLYELTQIGIPASNPQSAFEFARFVEYSHVRLDGYKHFPLIEGIKGIANLDCVSAFAIICRWDHRGVAKLTESILHILEASVSKEFITPSVSSSMLTLNISYWTSYAEHIRFLIEKYDVIGDSRQKSDFMRNVTRDITINCSTVDYYEIINSIYGAVINGIFLEREIVEDIENYSQFVTEMHRNKKADDKSSPFTYKTESKDEDKFVIEVDDFDIYSNSSLNDAIREIKLRLNNDFIRPHLIEFLDRAAEKCEPDKYVDHLNALIDINTNLTDFYTLEDTLKKRLEEWDSHPSVREWKKQNFEKVLRVWFTHFKSKRSIYYNAIKELANAFSVNDKELTGIIVNILPEKMAELSAGSVYQTIVFLKNRLTVDTNNTLISWVLKRWNAKIKSEFADGVWSEQKNLPTTADEIIAYTLRYVLGHPDTRIRWRGIHSLRRLVLSGNTNVLKLLLDTQNDRTCNHFQHKDFTFYWISAKLYLWICIAKLSKEVPALITAFKNEILNELHNKNLPHALIIKFIKETCRNLLKYDNSFYSLAEQKSIDEVLVSKYNPTTQSHRQGMFGFQYSEVEKHKIRFEFDRLDTLPYWYDRLADIFGLPCYEVALLADKYIVEKWGYTGDPIKDNHVHEKYQLTSNCNSSLPMVEDLRTYYEYHAMFCAATDLINIKPLFDYEFHHNSWDEWLQNHGLEWEDFWLSELRDPVPLQKKFWLPDAKMFSEEWRVNLDYNDFDEATGLKFGSAKFIACADYTRYFKDDYETFSISSALVSTSTSEALLRALQSVKNHYEYNIGDGINEEKFQLRSWLQQIISDHDSLDRLDPLANKVGQKRVNLGKLVTELYDIQFSQDEKKAYHNGKQISWYTCWSNLTERDRDTTIRSEGILLEVDVSFLLDFLRVRNMSLIVECVIDRRHKSKIYDYNNMDTVQLYLINANGKVKTSRGRDYQIR